jgi:nucleotide-binding universal stress UspA family protein/predicted transcriptional regulator
MMSKVLVPLDGSKLSELALPWAAYLARTRKASLVLAQAVPWPVLPTDGLISGYVPADVYEDVLSAERDSATTYLERLRSELASDDLRVDIIVKEGAPGTVVLNLADELAFDTIVMATHGRGGLTRAVLGSVALQIVQNALIPVLLVRASGEVAPSTPSFDRLLVPLDGSLFAERALDMATELAQPGSTVVLVRAEAAPRSTPDYERLQSGLDASVDEAGRSAIEYLSHVVQTQVPTALNTQTDVRLGAPPEQILAAATAHHADVIVMATHGRTGPSRWWLGSVADSVARHADRPVLLVSARALVARVSEPYCVGDVMTRHPVTALDTEPLAVVLRKLLRWRVSGLPVVNADANLVGFISVDELIDWHDKVTSALAREEAQNPDEYVRRLQAHTASLMTRPTPEIHESAPLGRAIHLLRERQADRLAVTSEGKLVGILTRTDILKVMAARVQATCGVANPSD